MCVVSNVGDYYRSGWPSSHSIPTTQPSFIPYTPPYHGPTKEQFEEFLELLRSAKKIDKVLGTPDCENEKKFAGFTQFLTPEQMGKMRDILKF